MTTIKGNQIRSDSDDALETDPITGALQVIDSTMVTRATNGSGLEVIGLKESGGQILPIGSILNGQMLRRFGNEVRGSSTFIPTVSFDQRLGTSADPTTTATTYLAIPQMTYTFTPAAAANNIRINFSSSFKLSNGGSTGRIAVFIDGVQEQYTERPHAASAANDEFSLMIEKFTQLSATQHTIEIKWKTSGGTLTALGLNRILIVEEYEG